MSKNVLQTTALQLHPDQQVYRGKVRDVYRIGEWMIMVASDRISAFDFILPRAIPCKGQVLNQLAAYFLQTTRDVAPNWWVAAPDPNVSVGYACEPVKVEMVIRGYLAGHAWRIYQQGGRTICGVRMPDGLREGDRFPEPIITPTTKADAGHDQDISREEIIGRGIVGEKDYLQMEAYTRALFRRGSEIAHDRGLLLVDTKYEFGVRNGNVLLIDEIHTPDSSRYYIAEGYEDRQQAGERQQQLSKEFVREWLMKNGFQGLEGQTMPDMPEEFVHEVSQRYIALYEKVSGRVFTPREVAVPIQEQVEANIRSWMQAQGLL